MTSLLQEQEQDRELPENGEEMEVFGSWYPIIQYVNSKGEKQLASFPYGWMKNSFKEGQQLSIAWDGDNPEIVFPMEDSCFLQKGWVYLILGVILLFVFVACMIHLYNIFCS